MAASKVKGVRGFMGEEALVREDAINKIRETYKLFGFEPVETPALEPLSLFTGKSGKEIEEQLYLLEDKKGEKLALRPEHTISKFKIIADNKSIMKPFKTYSIGNVWRYENPSSTHFREFTQCDIDIYYAKDIAYDAEIIACLDFALKRLGISAYKIHLNNRKILNKLLQDVAVPVESAMQVLREMDKIDKAGMDTVIGRISALIGAEKAAAIKDYMDGKLKIGGEGAEELNGLIRYLKAYKIDNFVVDNALVRGLDYYDGNVFEFVSEFAKASIASGGRYNKLGEKLSVVIPMVGGSIGFDRVVSEMIASTAEKVFAGRYCVISIGADEKAIEVASKLRNEGMACELLMGVFLSKALDYCNAKKIRYAVMVGKKEVENAEVTLRDLQLSSDRRVKESEL
jgi:histidyl-tRNA synthetase